MILGSDIWNCTISKQKPQGLPWGLLHVVKIAKLEVVFFVEGIGLRGFWKPISVNCSHFPSAKEKVWREPRNIVGHRLTLQWPCREEKWWSSRCFSDLMSLFKCMRQILVIRTARQLDTWRITGHILPDDDSRSHERPPKPRAEWYVRDSLTVFCRFQRYRSKFALKAENITAKDHFCNEALSHIRPQFQGY